MTNGTDDQKIGEIVQWFLDRDVLLGFDNVGGGEWHAVMLPSNTRIGSAAYGTGPTKREAAETAQRQYQEANPSVTKETVTNTGTSTQAASEAIAETTPVGNSVSMPYEVLQSIGKSVELPYEVEEIERVLTDYGWRIAFTDEPDGSVTGYLMAEKTGEVLKTARGDDFQDAYLGLGIDTYPPSEEVRRENH